MQPAAIEEVLKRLMAPKAATAIRAARDLRWITEQDPASLYGIRKTVLREAMRTSEVRVHWNLIIVLGRLPLRRDDKALVVDWFFERLADDSGLVRTMALQALFDLSASDPRLRSRVEPFAQRFVEDGTPAMRARARRLLKIASLKITNR